MAVMEGLWALVHALQARSRWMKRRYGVTGPQRLLVRAVGADPGCAPGEAARRLRLDAGTVTRLAAGLERLGLLHREGDPGDRRRVRLTLTERGRRLDHTTIAAADRAVDAALARFRPGGAAAAALIRRLTADLMPASARPPRR